MSVTEGNGHRWHANDETASAPQERTIIWSECPKHEGVAQVILLSVLFWEVAAASVYRPERPGGPWPAPQGEGCLRGEAASLSPQDRAAGSMPVSDQANKRGQRRPKPPLASGQP